LGGPLGTEIVVYAQEGIQFCHSKTDLITRSDIHKKI
jgi:hypothetical protein